MPWSIDWGEPEWASHQLWQWAPCAEQWYVRTCISLYHLPCVCRTLVPKIRVCPEMSVYSGILMCSHVWFRTALDWTTRTIGVAWVCCEDYWRRHAGRQMHNGTVAAQQIANMRLWIRSNQWADCILLFCDVCINIGMTRNLLQCLNVICECRIV